MSKKASVAVAFMMAIGLAACGGGDGSSSNDSGGGGTSGGGTSGGGTSGGGTSGGGTSTSLTNKQLQWYGHETAFTGVAVSHAIESILSPAVQLARPGVTVVACDEAGTATGTWTDADSDGKLSAGDRVDLTASECTFSEEGIPFSGKASVVFGAVTGAVFDDEANWTLKATATLGAGAQFDDSPASGALTVDVSHSNNGTPANDADDVDTIKVESAELKVTNTYGGNTYLMTITGFAAEFVYKAGPDADEYSKLQFAAKGSDPVLGSAFTYEAKLKSPLTYSWGKSGILAGAFETKIPTETITTTFSSASGNPGTVTFSSSLGGSTSLTYAQFDDLEP